MNLSRVSFQNLRSADAYDIWPTDDGTGCLVVVFHDGMSATLRTEGNVHLAVWASELDAKAFIALHAPELPRQKYDPCSW